MATTNALQTARRASEAVLSRNPANADERDRLAQTLKMMGEYKLAEKQFEQILKEHPAHEAALAHYCELLEYGTNGLMRIEALCRKALAVQPDLMVATVALSRAMLNSLRQNEGLALLETAIRSAPSNMTWRRELAITYLFQQGYSANAPDQMTRALRGMQAWAAKHFSAPAAASDLPAAKKSMDDKTPLKVGVLSADAYHHPMGQLLASFLGLVDRTRAEITFYNVGNKSDDVTDKLRGLVPRFVDMGGCTPDQLVARVRSDGMQVVLDAASLTQSMILSALAQRCAPVQLSWGGWVYDNPLQTMDGYIADMKTVPDEHAAAQFLHPVYRLPDCVYTFNPLSPRPAPSSLPALANGFLTFASFNNLAKVNPMTLDLWAAVLNAVPRSRLMLKGSSIADADTRKRLLFAMRTRGIAPDRLNLKLPSDYAAYMGDFGEVDVMLDCVPFNGGMTTIDGLWQGVPLLALAGRTHASRVGMSLMHAAGLESWVADGAEDYVDRAVEAACDLPALSLLRANLPQRLSTSTLGDSASFAAHMVGIWEEAWARLKSSTISP